MLTRISLKTFLIFRCFFLLGRIYNIIESLIQKWNDVFFFCRFWIFWNIRLQSARSSLWFHHFCFLFNETRRLTFDWFFARILLNRLSCWEIILGIEIVFFFIRIIGILISRLWSIWIRITSALLIILFYIYLGVWILIFIYNLINFYEIIILYLFLFLLQIIKQI